MDHGAKNDSAQDDDEDLAQDPISQIDMAVSRCLEYMGMKNLISGTPHRSAQRKLHDEFERDARDGGRVERSGKRNLAVDLDCVICTQS